METHNGGVEAENGALKGLETCNRRFVPYHLDEEQDPDPPQSEE